MADLTINADDVRDALHEFAESFEPADTERVEVGYVNSAADGIATVEGLPSVMAKGCRCVENGFTGRAQSLDTRESGVVVLGDFQDIHEGTRVYRTGEVLSVPVGDAFMGRVVNPIGEPMDNLGDIEDEGRRALALHSPGVTQRKYVQET